MHAFARAQGGKDARAEATYGAILILAGPSKTYANILCHSEILSLLSLTCIFPHAQATFLPSLNAPHA